MRNILAFIFLGLCVVLAGSANATPMQIHLSGTISSGVPVTPGDPFYLDLFVDSATPNESAIPGEFLASNPGTASTFLVVAVSGGISSIRSSAGTWNAGGNLTVGAWVLPYTGVVNGTGMTLEQILPDFSSPVTGTIDVDVTAINATWGHVIAAVDAVTITVVPEPTTALLLGLGIAALAGRRRVHPS